MRGPGRSAEPGLSPVSGWAWLGIAAGAALVPWLGLVAGWCGYFLRLGWRLRAGKTGFTGRLDRYRWEPWCVVTQPGHPHEAELTLIPDFGSLGRCYWSLGARGLATPTGAVTMLRLGPVDDAPPRANQRRVTVDDEPLDQRFGVRCGADDRLDLVRSVLDHEGFRASLRALPAGTRVALWGRHRTTDLTISHGFQRPDADEIARWFRLLDELSAAVEAALERRGPYR